MNNFQNLNGPGLPENWDQDRESQRFQSSSDSNSQPTKPFGRGAIVGEVIRVFAVIGFILGLFALFDEDYIFAETAITVSVAFYILTSIWITLANIGKGLQEKGYLS